MRRGKIKYHCQKCSRWFQINRTASLKKHKLLWAHIDGTSFRSLSNQYQISVGSAYNYCFQALKQLPDCAEVTQTYCNNFSGTLLVDGKYLSVKGYKRKIPVIYGLDYASHDIPYYLLSSAESYQTCLAFFKTLKKLNYPLEVLVCDDNSNIYRACVEVFPDVIIQLCQLHYLRSIRFLLRLDRNYHYRPFFFAVCRLFKYRYSELSFIQELSSIIETYPPDRLCASILIDLERKKDLLLGYLRDEKIPTTTNLIESFNSHLQGRLKSIKGFDSFEHAQLWLNGYFLRRRLKPFTDCEGKFAYLNGVSSLSLTKNPQLDLPIFSEFLGDHI